MKKIKIQKGIAIPAKKKHNQAAAAQMNEGDSILMSNRAKAIVFQRHAKEIGIKITMRRTKTDKYRCWRVS